MSEVLKQTAEVWKAARDLALEAREDFDDTADIVWDYFTNKGEECSFKTKYANVPEHRVTVNKVYEFVQLYTPYLYHRNPSRQVTPKSPAPPDDVAKAMLGLIGQQQDPVAQAVARVKSFILQHYLTWNANELDLKSEAHLALTEALVRGRGILWQELRQLPWGKVAGSFFVSCKDFLIDPDAEMIRDAGFVMRRKRRSVDQVMREFDLTRDDIKGSYTSRSAEAGRIDHRDEDDNGKHACDIVEYWEVYSRIGCGGRLADVSEGLRDALEEFGDHCYLVICDGCDFPLNLPPMVAQDPNGKEAIKNRIKWPTAFYNDPVNPWPFALLDPRPGGIWPESLVKPWLPYQVFLDWAYTFLMQHIKDAGRQTVILDVETDDNITDRIKNGDHLEVIKAKLRNMRGVGDMLQTITWPNLNGDFWTILQGVNEEWKKSSGVSDLMYAQVAKQMRSAQESSDRHQMATLRPEFLANTVDDWMGRAAKNEILVAAGWLGPTDVAPVFAEKFNPIMPPSNFAA